MFTGIIQALGTVSARDNRGDGCTIAIDSPWFSEKPPAIGDSIACNGICLTVVRRDGDAAVFDLSGETLKLTSSGQWQAGTRVNLEAALTLSTPLGGHLVSGHVDGLGRVVSRLDSEDSTTMVFAVARDLGRFVAHKGSVAIDGVSLTSHDISDTIDATQFTVSLVPHTLAVTTIGEWQPGRAVNIEVDTVARYVTRYQESAE